MAAVPAAGLYFAAWHLDWSALAALPHAALVIVPVGYSLSWLAGIPYLYALHRFGLMGWTGLAAGGLLVGTAVGTIVALMLFPAWDWHPRLFYLGLGATCGATVGLVYWASWRLAMRFSREVSPQPDP